MAWRLAQQLPGVERLTPDQGKDWNEQLTQSEKSFTGNQSISHSALTQRLWQWHLAASKLGKSEAYLSRITEVARAVVKGHPLSEKAVTVMERDLTAALAERGHHAVDRQDVSLPQTQELGRD